MLFILALFSCTKRDSMLDQALVQAKINRNVLEKVLRHYTDIDCNSEKLEAAKFLISNMSEHGSYNDEILDAYSDSLKHYNDATYKGIIYQIWNNIISEQPHPHVIFEKDIEILSDKYLIDNIDKSYEAWKNAPWNQEISLDIYCKYILPYRVNNEKLSSSGWRDTFLIKYKPLIAKETNVKKAFAIINQHITHYFRNTQPDYPRQMDALSIDKIRPGNCSLRCLYTIYALRALGIPACYDFVKHWSNYSTRGHSWVSLVTHQDSTFILHKGDSLPLYHNKIDGSVFKVDFLPEKEYPYPLDSVKKAAQVFRWSYEKQKDTPSVYTQEVTSLYGMSRSLKIKDAPIRKGTCNISIYLTGKDWENILTVPVTNHQMTVKHIGCDQLYLLTFKDEKDNFIRSIPIIFHSNGRIEYLNANLQKKDTIVVYRKYPLFIHQAETWCKMKGCVIEASATPDFKHTEALFTVKDTPFNFSFHPVTPSRSYRYVRYRNTNKWATALAEFEVYGQEIIRGKPIGSSTDKSILSKGIDGDYSTFVTSMGEDYWYGLNLGKNAPLIERVRFLPKNDANFVEPGHDYDFLCYDNGWKSLGIYTADSDSLVYEVPENSLMLLRDLTVGEEERPFIFRNGSPIWW